MPSLQQSNEEIDHETRLNHAAHPLITSQSKLDTTNHKINQDHQTEERNLQHRTEEARNNSAMESCTHRQTQTAPVPHRRGAVKVRLVKFTRRLLDCRWENRVRTTRKITQKNRKNKHNGFLVMSVWQSLWIFPHTAPSSMFHVLFLVSSVTHPADGHAERYNSSLCALHQTQRPKSPVHVRKSYPANLIQLLFRHTTHPSQRLSVLLLVDWSPWGQCSSSGPVEFWRPSGSPLQATPPGTGSCSGLGPWVPLRRAPEWPWFALVDT